MNSLISFLEKLYSNDYFEIGLFMVITVLAFTFLVILFFGKKDQRVREERASFDREKQRKNEESGMGMHTLDPIPLTEAEIRNIEAENKEEVVVPYEEEIDPFSTTNIILNTDYISEENQEGFSNEIDEVALDDDIYDVDPGEIEEEAAQIVEESINEVLDKYNVEPSDLFEEENVVEEEHKSLSELSESIEDNQAAKVEEKTDKDELNVFEKPSNIPSPAVFSSVYLNNEEREEKDKPEVEEKKEEVKPTVPPRFTRSGFDMPKKNIGAINENIISSINKEIENPFDKLEEDSYTIKK